MLTPTPDSDPQLAGLCLVGGGQMGRAMMGGMIAAGRLTEQDLTVVEPASASRDWWEQRHPGARLIDDLGELSESSSVTVPEVFVLAVKPNIVPVVARQADGFWDGKLVVSIAAGVTLASLASWIGHDRVVRVMPNTPSLVGQGASAFCTAAGTTAADRKRVESVLSSVGLCEHVEEKQIDAVTGLSGSGPAYVFTIIEGLADGGVLAGLPRDLAMRLATQTVLGAATMVGQTGLHPGELKDAVASPAGTTIVGLNVLEKNALRATMADAVAAAAERSRQLG